MSGGPVLALEGLTAGYDQAAVVRDLDLTVGPGEVVALLGPNGAGKTTTLRVISGIVRPLRGRVTFDGEDLRRVSPTGRARRGIAHVPEGRGIFFGLTVAEHFRLARRSGHVDEEIAYEHIPLLRELLLLDELSLGLAPVIVESLLPVVREHAQSTGCAVLLVEQHVQLALEVADRGYVLSHGEIVLQDRAEVLRADRQLLTASYLGEQQVPVGEVSAAGGKE